MKKLTAILVLTSALLLIPSVAYASSTPTDIVIEKCEDGSFFETVIVDESERPDCYNLCSNNLAIIASSEKTQTKSKITSYKNSEGKVMWYVKVTGTFTYNGTSSRCTNSSITAASNNKLWKVTNKSASKSGNKASATATGTHYQNGIAIQKLVKTVTLTCSPSGRFS